MLNQKLDKNLLNGMKICISIFTVFLLVMMVDFPIPVIHRLTEGLRYEYYLNNIINQLYFFITGLIIFTLFTRKSVSVLFQRKGDFKRTFLLVLLIPVIVSLSFLILYLSDPVGWSVLIQSESSSVSKTVFDIIVFSILTGISEEMLYRGAIIGVCVYYVSRIRSVRFSDKWFFVIMSAMIFAVAHMTIFFSPFTIQYDIYQIITAFGLGFVEAYLFVKSGSLLHSIMIHAAWNCNVIIITNIVIHLFS